MDVNDLTENPLANAGGKVTFLATIVMNWVNWLYDADINQVLVICTSALGLFYMGLKIYKLIGDIKQDKKTRKKK